MHAGSDASLLAVAAAVEPLLAPTPPPPWHPPCSGCRLRVDTQPVRPSNGPVPADTVLHMHLWPQMLHKDFCCSVIGHACTKTVRVWGNGTGDGSAEPHHALHALSCLTLCSEMADVQVTYSGEGRLQEGETSSCYTYELEGSCELSRSISAA